MPLLGDTGFPKFAADGQGQRRLRAASLGGVSQALEDRHRALGVIALNLEDTPGHRPAGCAGRPELPQDRAQVGRRRVQTLHDGHDLALSASLAADTDGLVLGQPHVPVGAAGAGALIQRYLANMARNRPFQRSTSEESGHPPHHTGTARRGRRAFRGAGGWIPYAAMTDFHEPQAIRITCAPGLVDYLRREVEELGYTVNSSRPTGLEITAGMHDAMRLNLFLRTAFNVLVLIDAFTCANPDELY